MTRRKNNKKKNKDETHSANSLNDNIQGDGQLTNIQKPFKVKSSDILGRYLVAGKGISAGEVIIVDHPIVVGPCEESKPLCIGCYSKIDLKTPQTYKRCGNCSWPLCSAKCSGYGKKHGHSHEECDAFSKSLVPKHPVDSFQNFYYAITPFRCLLVKKENSENSKVLESMETHSNERKKNLSLWETNQKLAVDVIRKTWGLTEFTEEDIHFACGILEINGFEIIIPNVEPLRALYPNAFLCAHNCVPNTCHSNDSQFQMILRATSNISLNEIISITYSYTLQSTLKRRKHLQDTKFFQCTCKRCSDPTELGTYTGAMKCTKCKTGLILPTNPLDDSSLWKCRSAKCDKELQVSQIIPLLNGFFEELDSINGNDIEGYEKFLEKCEIILHPNHYLCLSAMHNLYLLYGKIDGYLINDLSTDQLQRKIDICKILLAIFEKLEPGLTKQRGILLYELQAPLMVLLRRRYENENIPKKEMKQKLKEIIKYLEEAYSILSKEPENSPEEVLAEAAHEAIAALKEWQSFL